MRRGFKLRSLIFLCVLVGIAAGASPIGSQEQPKQEQEKPEKEQQPPKKKKGGFFGGLKAVAGGGSEQTEATRTAGSKTVGEGEQIGDAQPTAADRQAVSGMESYSVPENDLKKFQEAGTLKAKP